ncbi:hypothetical protein [Lacrimispora defluvii]|uniref:Uncharacterized protein n=1 Tax=Lacrimispora defluvii TaxID=2719233 RepID=A0ABX1W0Y1_9FIRM|nr:hypothetical protein [Lacrimispora defluvii]NNJ33335.1 hypothetical protein [Lacrimispora defluvii]
MGKNLALNADITASSYVDPYAPGRAVNGIVSDPTSRWLCAALPGWLRLDLKKSCWVGQWTVKSIGGNAGLFFASAFWKKLQSFFPKLHLSLLYIYKKHAIILNYAPTTLHRIM